ncbi:MAG: signal peptidase II [Alphaproteobacteria bacterium]|nr:signal peptidase II [Alphaproteobacteria bacterium]
MAETPRRLGYGLAVLLFLADQLTKAIIIGPVALKQLGQIYLLPILNLTWVENYGIALGMLQAGRDVERWLLVVATGAIAVFVANWIRRERSRGDSAALGLVLGGALGNITDRVRFGHVVDFIDVHIGGFRPFLVFNLADAAITIGVVMLLVHALFARDEAAKTETEDA